MLQRPCPKPALISGFKMSATARKKRTLPMERPVHAAAVPGADRAPDTQPVATGHISVLPDEVLSFWQPRPGARVLDATLGLGGHAEAILQKSRDADCDDVELLGLDRDARSLARAAERLAVFGNAAHTAHCLFSDCDQALAGHGWDAVDFALADIGVSSVQLDVAGRGFSFLADGPLDMRMNQGSGKSAADIVNDAPVEHLRGIIGEYGEEPMAGRIARAIDDARRAGRIESTLALARIVEMAYPAKWRAMARKHPATRTFQALRMAVNDELGELERFLVKANALLRSGGRLAVITFHSLEDRMVKHYFRDEATACRCPKHFNRCFCGHTASLKVLTKKPVCPGERELAANPRASSAKLRVAEKL